MKYQFPKSLIESINSKECVLFIGSGISTWSGAPSWYELLKDYSKFLENRGLCDEKEKEEILSVINNGDLLIAASYCKSLSTDGDFAEFIREEFFDRNLKPHKVHELIISLGSDCYITTNYDSLIEITYQKLNNGLMLRQVNNDQPIEQASIQKHSSSKFIFKPHGDMNNVDSIILTQEDYRRIRYNMESTIETLKHLLIQRPVLYLGFGLTDPTFLLIKDFIAETYKGGNRQHFAVMSDVTDLERKFWHKNYGITLVSYPTKKEEGHKHHNLIELLNDLNEYVKNQKDNLNIELSSSSKLALLRYCDTKVFGFQSRNVKIFNLDGVLISPNNKLDEPKIKKYIPIGEALKSNNRLIIVGEPGSGKSTSLEYFTSQIAIESRDIVDDDFAKNSIPVFIQCKEYSGSIIDLIKSSLPITVDKEETLKGGLYTIVIDAVNEIPKEYHETKFFEQNLKEFIEQYSLNKILLSTRSLNYLSFLDFPVFEIERLNRSYLTNALEEKNLKTEEISTQLLYNLSSPFFFKLFIDYITKEDLSQVTAKLLINKYFVSIDDSINREYGYNINFLELFASIGYKLTNLGEINIDPNQILKQIESSGYNKNELFNILVSKKVLLPDGEGKIGFVHQTILEFLSAYHLTKLYAADKSIIDEKIIDSRWDETMMLFVSLLDVEKAKKVIEEIVIKDIFYAYSIYEFASIKDLSIKEILIEQLFLRLNDTNLILNKKSRLGWLISKIISDQQYLLNLIDFIDDDDIGGEVAYCIAKTNHKESIAKIIECLFEKGNSYPSGYAKALIEYKDNTILHILINKTKEIQDVDSKELLISNVAYILSCFDTIFYLFQIKEMLASDIKKDKLIAVKLLEGKDSPEVVSILSSLLDDSNDDLKKEAIHCLGGKSWPYNKETISSQEIIDKSFSNLESNSIGSYFASYLKDLKSDKVIEKAYELMKTVQNGSLKINLANIVFERYYESAKEVILEHLVDFRPEYEIALHQSLFLNISDFSKEIIPLINKNDELRNRFIIENYSNESDNISNYIDEDVCRFLLVNWETLMKKESIERNDIFYWYYSVPRFLSLCTKHTKSIILDKVNDSKYELRHKILSIVSLLEIKKKDFTDQTINWLFEEMTKEKVNYRNYATSIIGKIGDEEFAIEKLIPLLKSENLILRNNAYVAIEEIEKSINKRLINK